MRIDEQVRSRARELIETGNQMVSVLEEAGHPGRAAALRDAHGWLASAQHLIKIIYPDPLASYNSRAAAAAMAGSTSVKVGGTISILEHLLADVDAGVVTRVADAARAEVFDDFLDQAEYYLRGRKVPQAGVIAGVVFEDTIRRACERRGIPQKGVELEQLISALVKAEAMPEIKAKRARAAAGVRTKATHAQWDEFTAEDVDSTVRLTRELIDSLLV